ncbi:AraC family transcriptional regulator [Kribbella sp. NPDC026611]|uniref:helix-turn-helix domain-containing protein n=1 Tax=Kribbella sp. NPDC026611 TaxID=3154911 RepID=UPI0033CA96DA
MAKVWLDATRAGTHGGVGDLILAGRQDHGQGILTGGRPRYYPAYAFSFVTRGIGRYRDANRDVAIGPGTVAYVFPGVPHWYGVLDPTGHWDEVYLAFTGPIFDVAADQGLLDVRQPLRSLRDVAYWKRRIETFRTRRPPIGRRARDAEACEVLQLLADFAAAGDPEPPQYGDDWIELSCSLLRADPGERVDLESVALAVGMPYETWRRRFRDRTGYSPGRYRLNHRIDTAVELARYSTMPSREIAAALGFSDEQHLARHLKAATGRTARQLRNQIARSPAPNA